MEEQRETKKLGRNPRSDRDLCEKGKKIQKRNKSLKKEIKLLKRNKSPKEIKVQIEKGK